METISKLFPLPQDSFNIWLREATRDGSYVKVSNIEPLEWKKTRGTSLHTLIFSDGRQCTFKELHKVNTSRLKVTASTTIAYSYPIFF